jgi:PAS domain S-box-containing protein
MPQHHSSLSRSLTIAIVACVALISTLVLTVFLYFNSKDSWQSLETQADDYITYLSGALQQPLWTFDEPALRRIARTVFRNSDFVRLKVEGNQRKILYELWAPENYGTIKRRTSIMYNDEKIGVLELEVSTRAYVQKLNNLILSSAITLATVLLTLLILNGFILNRLLKRPLDSLLKRIDLLSQGKPVSTSSKVRHQELSQIINQFDAMAREVTQRTNSLLVSKRMLEDEIKERNAVERALMESEKRYRVLTDVVPIAIIVHRELKILIANSQAMDLFRVQEPSDLIGSFIPDLVYPDDLGIFYERTQAIMDKGNTAQPREYRWVRLDGTSFSAEAMGIRISQFGELATLTVLRDLTQQKRDETEKNRLMTQLQQAQKMEAVGTLASGIAHDFNNILQAISGTVQLMTADGGRSALDRHRLEGIDTAAMRASDLVKRLLTFGRKVEPKLGPVDLNQEVMRSVAILERTQPKMIQLETSLCQDLPLINGDVSQLEHVVINLGNNAADAMPDGGTMRINTEVACLLDGKPQGGNGQAPSGAEYVKFSMSDTGTGMDEATLKQIFDPFFTTKEVGKGTGLGLSTVYGIVQSHGAQIRCQSKPGQGTSFEIYFPVYRGEDNTGQTDSETPAPIVGGQESIMVVDDEASILTVVSDLLSDLGYSVYTAQSGEAALKLYQEKGHEIDLVILDMGMPGMGGKRCLKRLKEINPGVKVLIASGYSGDQVVSEVRKAGALAYLRKPYRLHELVNIMAELLGGSRAR